MCIRFFLFVGMLVFAALIAEGTEPLENVSATAKQLNESFVKGDVELHVNPVKVASGSVITIRCELHCSSGVAEAYNPFLCEEFRLPAQIYILSLDGRIRQSVLKRNQGASRYKEEDAWVRLRDSQALGRELRVQFGDLADRAAGNRPDIRKLDLPRGEYVVQAVYNRWLLAIRPNSSGRVARGEDESTGDAPRPIPPFSSEQMDLPIAVSAPVRLVIE